jgi:hypothetical protein
VAAESQTGSGSAGETPAIDGLFAWETDAECSARARPKPCSPVFIVGSPRSGTSALVDALFAGGYHGFREGNLLGLLANIKDTISNYFASADTDNPNTLISQVSTTNVSDSVRDAVCSLVASMNLESPWLDKSGNVSMLKTIPSLISYWPTARIIYAKRRGIENIASRLIKFPTLSFSRHCDDWALTMRTWRLVRSQIEPWRFIEIDQQDMVSRPNEAAKVLGAFLQLGREEQLALEATFRSGRPQQTAQGTAERKLPLAESGWTEEQQNEFLRVCGPEMSEYGYALE